MAGDGDPRSNVEVTCFIKFCHNLSTRAGTAGFAPLGLLAGGCAGPYSVLEPGGPAAASVATLWWIMLAGAVLILGGVTATALYSLRRNRAGHALSEKRVLVGWGLVFPVLTLGALMIFVFAAGESLLTHRGSGRPAFRAHASQWLWTFHYPGGHSSTGILHVPAGETFYVEITSEDVIHSFWVPRLGGKIDAIPGRSNRVVLKADAPGRYHGLCAEYCGIGHALMPFAVEAHLPEKYHAALAEAEGIPGHVAFPLQERPEASGGKAVRSLAEHVRAWLGISK